MSFRDGRRPGAESITTAGEYGFRARGQAPAPRNDDHRYGRYAQTDRHLLDPHHRRRADRHRPGLRVRLFRHAGLQGAQGRGLPDRPGQLQSGDHHDRPGSGGRDLYRADHAGDRRQDHRQGALRASRRFCAIADHGRPDRAQHRAVASPHGHAGEIRRQEDSSRGRSRRRRWRCSCPKHTCSRNQRSPGCRC